MRFHIYTQLGLHKLVFKKTSYRYTFFNRGQIHSLNPHSKGSNIDETLSYSTRNLQKRSILYIDQSLRDKHLRNYNQQLIKLNTYKRNNGTKSNKR